MIEPTNSWTEYRLLILEMLERHEASILNCEQRSHTNKHEAEQSVYELRQEVFQHCDAKFVQLGDMSKTQVANAKRDLIEEMNNQRAEDTQVKVAKITASWEFRGLVVSNLVTVIIALLALAK